MKLRQLSLPALILSMLPLILFATFRGTSGKDSGLYLLRFYNFDEATFELSFFNEPILNTLIYISRVFTDSHELFFFLHATLVCTLFCIGLKKFSELKLYYYSVAPMFLIDGLTNGMRVTIAYHLFIIAVAYKKKLSLFPIIFLSHVSGVFMYMVSFVLDSLKTELKYKALFIFIAGIGTYIAVLNIDSMMTLMPRVNSKLHQYGELVLPTKYSGIADLSVLLSIFLAISLGRVSGLKRIKYLVVGFVLVLVMYFMIQQSLAFIRVTKLIIIGLLVSPYVEKLVTKDKLIIFLFIGVLYTFNFIRQITFGHGFLPYPGPL